MCKMVSRNLILLILAFVGLTNVTQAEVRNALVIGNGQYQQVGVLDNPPNDAQLMAETLRQLDFNVIELIDATQMEMKRAVRDFGTRLNQAGRDGIGLFYYAGHGVQVDGANYIIPIDAQINKEGDVDIEAVNANSVLSMMEYSNARLNFVVLDACRNNPYSRGFRSSVRGLAKMSAPTGSFIAYATSPGDVAVDGSGTNSPYTASLVKHISQPGVPIEKVFREVRNEVREVTANQQTPWESSSLVGGDFYFKTIVEVSNVNNGQQVTVTSQAVPADNASAAAAAQTAATVSQPVVIKTIPNPNIELVFWDSIKDSSNPAIIQAYLNKFPNGIFVEIAKLKLVALQPATESVAASNSSSSSNSLAASSTTQPVATAVVVSAKPKPSAAKEPAAVSQPISLASVVDDSTSSTPGTANLDGKLSECRAHLDAKRLTTGAGGNALSCYSEVLQQQPGHPEALAGLIQIEQKYSLWASVAIDRGNINKAASNINKLRAVNPENSELDLLDSRLESLISSETEESLPAADPPSEATQQVAAVQPAAKATPKAIAQPATKTELKKCESYIDAGRWTGKGSSNAWGCYQQILNEDSQNADAKKGLTRIEDLLFEKFEEEIKDKSLRQAKRTMLELKNANRSSKYVKPMKKLHAELTKEMRW